MERPAPDQRSSSNIDYSGQGEQLKVDGSRAQPWAYVKTRPERFVATVARWRNVERGRRIFDRHIREMR